MNIFAKSALVLGAIGTVAIGSMTASEARSGRWVAGAAGFAVAPRLALRRRTLPPTTAATTTAVRGLCVRHDSPGYAPAYAYTRRGIRTATLRRRPTATAITTPRATGYNSNTLSPWQDRKMRGTDY